MADETRTFSGIDRQKFLRLRDAIGSYVTLPEGDNGTIESRGVKGSFLYEEPAQTLTLTIHEAPFFIPIGMIWSGIEQAVSSS